MVFGHSDNLTLEKILLWFLPCHPVQYVTRQFNIKRQLTRVVTHKPFTYPVPP